jgi:hypothetical protein
MRRAPRTVFLFSGAARFRALPQPVLSMSIWRLFWRTASGKDSWKSAPATKSAPALRSRSGALNQFVARVRTLTISIGFAVSVLVLVAILITATASSLLWWRTAEATSQQLASTINEQIVGDAVNVASRLECANKHYGTKILIGAETKRLVQDAVVTREIDSIAVYGRTEGLAVHELIGSAEEAGR